MAPWIDMLKDFTKFVLYNLYERRLAKKLKQGPVPKHLGIILDGNRRYAKALGLPREEGHRRGMNKIKSVLEWCGEFDIPVVTLWGFSTQNFSRDPQEVAALMKIFIEQAKAMLTDEELERRGVRVRALGRLHDFPVELQNALKELEGKTAHRTGMLVQLALAYGGREEIVDAVKSYMHDAAQHGTSLAQAADALNEEAVSKHMYNGSVPDPDFIIRTSGEIRLSGFMLWQAAYSEYYFLDVNWPGFRYVDFLRALRSFQLRQRRFGK